MTQLWDPLWEYVLEDYDHVAEAKAKRRSRSSRNSGSSNRSGGKPSRSSSSRNVQAETKKRNQLQEDQSEASLLNMSMNSWNLFDTNNNDDGTQNEYNKKRSSFKKSGDQRDDDSEQVDWNNDWFSGGRDSKQEEEQAAPAKRKGILRRSESKSSTGSPKNSSRSLVKQASGRSSQDYDDAYGGASGEIKTKKSSGSAGSKKKKGRRSLLKKSPSASSKKLALKQSKSEASQKPSLEQSKSETSNRSASAAREDPDESAGFSEMWDVLTGAAAVPANAAPARNTPFSATHDDDCDDDDHDDDDDDDAAKDEQPSASMTRGKGKRFSLSLRKSNSEGSGLGRERERKDKSVVKVGTNSSYMDQKRTRLFRRKSKQKLVSQQREISDFQETTEIKEVGLNDACVEKKDPTGRNADQNQRSFAEFDPLMMLFEVAGRLDPWAVDSSVADSQSETTASETTGPVDESSEVSTSDIGNTTRGNSDAMGSLLDQPLPSPNAFDPRYAYQPQPARAPEAAYSTEIRLKVNTVGDTLSEEVYNRATPLPGEESEPHTESTPTTEATQFDSAPASESATEPRPSIMSSSTHPSLEESSKPPVSFDELEELGHFPVEKERTGAQPEIPVAREEQERSALPAQDDVVRVPTELHIQKDDHIDDILRDLDAEGYPRSPQRGIWKAVCCSVGKKMNKYDTVNRLGREDAAKVFPTTRMISNGKSRSITGEKADLVNGVMGVPSDDFVHAEGPQSLYAYDYESNEHMDVCYTEMNKKPRGSITVRELGTPPSLSKSSIQDSIVVQVEASTISQTDCMIRQGRWWHDEDEPPLPNTPGVDIVGKVYRIKKTTELEYDLHPRETVLSLTKWGGNSRYQTIHPNELVKVPDGLDPAEIACLPETYLTAFQCLHMGQSGSRRYRDNSLKGKSILILGCMSNNVGKAIIELALNAGVANIYATSKKKHWKTLISYGVLPLSPEPMEWIHRIEGTVDLVLAPNGAVREDVTPVHFRALRPKQGQLILCGHRSVGSDIPINDWKKDQYAFSCGRNKALTNILNKSYAYDVYESWDDKLDLCKKDLTHLLLLLEQGALKPEVLDRLPLSKVAKAQDLLESKRLPGFLICEPWMRGKKRA
ncbi:MAG: hypothetical protein SGILL_006596, partial [Bacillariaceae sp.]